MPAQSKDKTPLASIQCLRAMAALSVCLSHALHEGLFLPHGAMVDRIASLPFEMGVDLFFIISGFIMMFTSAKMFGRQGAPKAFALRRLIRILPTYWFFTALMVVATLVFADKLNSAHFSLSHAVLSFLFIPHNEPGISDGIHPILSVGWTLLYEMFFYLAFSLALFLPKKRGLLALGSGFLLLFVSARMNLWTSALNELWADSILFEFILGIAAYEVFAMKASPVRKSAILIGGAAALYGAGWLSGLQAERIFSYGMPSLALFGLLAPLRLSASAWALLVLVGDASYALYLSHAFSIEVTKQAFVKLLGAFTAEGWFIPAYVVTCVLVSVIAATLFFLIVEKPATGWLRTWLLPSTGGTRAKK